MATTKKSSKKTEPPREENSDIPEYAKTLLAVYGKDDPKPELHIATPDEYIAAEYPGLMSTQNIPQLLKALLRETVIGRMQK